MDEKFKLGQWITIKATKVKGRIFSVWDSLSGQTQYQVYYYDTTGRRSESWMIAEEITDEIEVVS